MTKAKRICSVPDCGNGHFGRGLCTKHYQRWAKHGSPDIVKTKKPSVCTIDGCGRPNKARGLCLAHSERVKRTGSPQADIPIRHRGEGQQFILDVARIPYTDDCITWPYARDKLGRGFGSHRGKTTIASRAVCIEAHGEPPSPSHEAAHSCGNGHLGCVNPHHLRWATRTENEADKIAHGTRLRGEKMKNHILTDADCEAIRALRGSMSQKAIATIYGVSQQHISAVQTGRFRADPSPRR